VFPYLVLDVGAKDTSDTRGKNRRNCHIVTVFFLFSLVLYDPLALV